MSDTCGYTVIDSDGNEQPCGRPATDWRWYQDVPHEDCLDVACDWHANEGGRIIHAAEAQIADYYLRACDAERQRDEAETEADRLRGLLAEAEHGRADAWDRGYVSGAWSAGRYRGTPIPNPYRGQQ